MPPLSRCFALTAFVALCLGHAGTALAQEWEDYTPYYEDDAWYDVSEWFDGNDYNPTDETIGNIDDEVYDFGKLDYDYDNDINVYQSESYNDADANDYDAWDSVYGYDARFGDDDWFYDYYDDGHASYSDTDGDGIYDYAYRYFDYDGDGVYDASLTTLDYDHDGLFDDYEYYAFVDEISRSDREKSRGSTSQASEERRISGTIEKTKSVSLPNRTHQVVQLSDSGERYFADLGPSGALRELNIQQGDEIQVRGPMSRVGGKQVLMANSLTINDETTEIDRSQRDTKGKIIGTHTAEIRGAEHIIVLLERNGRKRAADLGPAEGLGDLQLNKGDQITLSGPRVKVGDRLLVMAQTVHKGDKNVQVQRVSKSRQSGDRARSDDSNRQQQASQGQRQKRPGRVSGKIVALRMTTVRDSERQVAQVETDQGRKVLIDLGPALEFDADLREGDTIRAAGLLTSSGKQHVLVARRAQVDGQSLQIPSSHPRRRTRTISGEIVGMRTITIRGEDRQLVALDTDRWGDVYADLGARSRLGTDLSEGDRVTVEGIVARTGSRRVLVALKLTRNGDTFDIRSLNSQGGSAQ